MIPAQVGIKYYMLKESPGHDGILYEHIICAKQPIDMALTALFNSVLNFEEIPGQWKTSLLIPLTNPTHQAAGMFH